MKKKFSGILISFMMIFLLAFPVAASETTADFSTEGPVITTEMASAEEDVAEEEAGPSSRLSGQEIAGDPGEAESESPEETWEAGDESREESLLAVYSTGGGENPEEGSEEGPAEASPVAQLSVDGSSSAEEASTEEETSASEKSTGEIAAAAEETDPDTGVMQDPASGKWYYYRNGKIDTSYTGFAENRYGTWYVESGLVTKKTNGVFKDASGAIGFKNDWYYVLNSKVQVDFTGLADYRNASGWWYISNGRVDRSFSGLAQNKNGWYYLTSGKVNYAYTGFASNKSGSWYVNSGKVSKQVNGVYKDSTGAIGSKNSWYYVLNSKVQTGFTGLADYKNASGWWYISNGKVDRSVTTVAKNKNGWYYVRNGKVDRSYTGFSKNHYGSWYVDSGRVTKKVNGVFKDASGAIGAKNAWYYVLNNKVQTDFTGVADYRNASGQWYVTNGKVDRSFNGTYTQGKVTYTIQNGKVTKKTGGYLICIDPGHQTRGNSAQEAIGPGSSTTKAKVSDGTRGVSTGLAEYQLNLTVSLKLRDELEARGYDVLMTRTTNDVSLSNIDRATIANNANADALIHIHANGDTNSSVNGITVACPSSSNPYVSNMVSADRALASSILNHMVKTTGANNMGLWITDEMTGLNWAKMPAVIVEMGFMSNPTEDQNMAKDSYQNKIVQGIADGIDEYFEANE